jgi:hypothetical protein
MKKYMTWILVGLVVWLAYDKFMKPKATESSEL